MDEAAANFQSPRSLYADFNACLEDTEPDLVLLCPATARHAEWTEKLTFNAHILMEKPFAATGGSRSHGGCNATREATCDQLPLAGILRIEPHGD